MKDVAKKTNERKNDTKDLIKRARERENDTIDNKRISFTFYFLQFNVGT